MMVFNFPNGEADLFRNLESFRDELNRAFSESFGPAGAPAAAAGVFPVNVYGNDDELVLTAEMPGVDPGSVELSVEDNLLTVSFARPELPDSQGASYHRRERAYGRFQRTVELPMRVDADKAEAHAENGVLQVRLPRLDADKPRRISIRAGN